MARSIDYYHFLISPWSYLAIGRFNALQASSGAAVRYLPIDVATTFAQMGGVPPAKRHPSRQRLRLDELRRWSRHLDVPINLQPAHFPTDQTLAARAVHACNALGRGDDAAALSDACLSAVWRDERDIADRDTLAALIGEVGGDAEALLAEAERDAAGDAFAATTKEAHERDVFGSPTWVLDGEIFWGQDRLDFLERALG